MLFFFFFNDTATTEIYTLSLHDALPISSSAACSNATSARRAATWWSLCRDRKSTRLNSSHGYISYAVFCLKKKKKKTQSNYYDRLRGVNASISMTTVHKSSTNVHLNCAA